MYRLFLTYQIIGCLYTIQSNLYSWNFRFTVSWCHQIHHGVLCEYIFRVLCSLCSLFSLCSFCSLCSLCSLCSFFTRICLKSHSTLLLLLLLSTPLHQRAASRVQHPNHVAANSLSPQVARKGSTLSGFVQRSRLEREVGRDLHSNKWEEVWSCIRQSGQLYFIH